ncbi:MAG: hypothetical protein Q9220_006637 [cf. Caloplaca sp. 1 TL-2023]
MADKEEWSSNANEALSISFIQAGQASPNTLSTFQPTFTYPIFGEEECIFGYQELRINLRFAAHDLRPNVSIEHDKQFKAVGETRALDITDTLKEWLPEVSFESPATFDSTVQQDAAAKGWRPPGELVNSYQSRGRTFEIWSSELADPATKQLIDRIQILISLFIEGGTPIPLDDQSWSLARWRVYFIYEKLSSLPSPTTSPYSLVGYSTTYRFTTHPSRSLNPSQPPIPTQTFTLPPASPINPSLTLPSRTRISQFLILPPHQHASHGTHLYNTIYNLTLTDPAVYELTVEDPSEAFDALRDTCDYAHLSSTGTFAQISLTPSLPAHLFARKPGIRVPTAQLLNLPLLLQLKAKDKLAPRQFSRLVEMHLLSLLPKPVRSSGTARLTKKARTVDEADRMWYYWRLLVKQRIYKRGRDVLAQLDRAERVEKCEDAVGEVVGEYEGLLRGWEERGKRHKGKGEGERENGVGGDGEGVGRRERGKRKVVLEDEEEEGTPEPKRVKDGAAG